MNKLKLLIPQKFNKDFSERYKIFVTSKFFHRFSRALLYLYMCDIYYIDFNVNWMSTEIEFYCGDCDMHQYSRISRLSNVYIALGKYQNLRLKCKFHTNCTHISSNLGEKIANINQFNIYFSKIEKNFKFLYGETRRELNYNQIRFVSTITIHHTAPS